MVANQSVTLGQNVDHNSVWLNNFLLESYVNFDKVLFKIPRFVLFLFMLKKNLFYIIKDINPIKRISVSLIRPKKIPKKKKH